MAIPPRYKGHTRGHWRFYGSDSSEWERLTEALKNRGYEIEKHEEIDEVDNIPEGLPEGRDSKIIEAVVIYRGDEMKRTSAWDPLVWLSDANEWSVAYQNDNRVRDPRRKRF